MLRQESHTPPLTHVVAEVLMAYSSHGGLRTEGKTVTKAQVLLFPSWPACSYTQVSLSITIILHLFHISLSIDLFFKF
jgi:hypothetical protein